mmetsp:Transcript_132882/g.230003  ORF Transcript_132882/g.230003 Transcript_132882/m.230003 type:complete len:240 (+) Transcript_132882:2-721(+)
MAAWKKLQGIPGEHEAAPGHAMLRAHDQEADAQPVDCTLRDSKDLPQQLPEGWVMRSSTRTGQVYYCNEKLKISQFELPVEAQPPPSLPQQLPEGWVMRSSTRTGQVYYCNEKLKISQFELPVETHAQPEVEEDDKHQDDDYEAALDAQLDAVAAVHAVPKSEVSAKPGENGDCLAASDALMAVPDALLEDKASEPGMTPRAEGSEPGINEVVPKPDLAVGEQTQDGSDDDEDTEGVWL